MRLSAPRATTWWIAVIVFIVGVIGMLADVSFLNDIYDYLLVLAFVILGLGTMLRGL